MGHDENQNLPRSSQDQQNYDILKALLNSPISGMICVKDLQGKVILANTAMLQMLGRSESEVIGKDDLDGLGDPEEIRKIRANDRRVLEEGLSIQEEELVVTGNRCRSCVFTKSPLKDADGRVIGILGIGIDITDRKEAETRLRASEERFRLAFENARDAIFWADADTGVLVNCNPAAEALVGRSREEIIGQPFTVIHPTKEIDNYVRIFRTYTQSGAKGLLKLEVVRKDGRHVPVEISAAITQLGGQRILQGIFRDITERERHQTEMEAQYEAIREREAMLEAFFAASPGILNIVDEDFRYVKTDRLTPTYFGLDSESIAGRSVADVAPAFVEQFGPMMRRVIETGQPEVGVETYSPVPGRPGEIAYWRASYFPVPLPGGRCGLGVMGTEITESRRVEQALADSERKYRLLHETMTDAFVLVGMDGRIREFNKAYQDMLGYEADEIYRLTYTDITPPQWRELEAEIVRTQILPRGHSDIYTKEYRRKDGKVFPVELRTFLLRDRAGAPEGMWAIVRDITERQAAVALIRKSREDLELRVKERTAELSQTVAALRDSEQRYRQLFDTVPDAVLAFDGTTGLCVDMNQAAERMFGYAASEARTVNVLDVSAEPERTKADFHRIASEGKIVNIPLRQCRRKDGTAFPAEASVGTFEVGGCRVVCGVFRDITERLQAHERLRKSEEWLRIILRTAMDGFWLADEQGRLLEVNDAYCRMSGYSGQELLAMRISDLEVSETGQDVTAHFRKIMARGEDRFETRHRRKDGSVYDVEVSVQYRPNEDVRYVSFLRDITERKRAQQQLIENREELGSVLACMDDLLFVVDTEGRFVHYYQPSDSHALYVPSEVFLGKHYRDILPPEAAKEFAGAMDVALRTGKAQAIQYSLDMPNGRRWFNAKCSVQRNAQRVVNGIIVVARDVTERVVAEQDLRDSETRYRVLFEQSPVGLWEMDFSQLRPYVAALRAQGVQDLRQYFKENPDAENALIASTRAVAVNQAAVRMHEAASKEELLAPSASYAPEYRGHMVEARLALVEGRRALQARIKGETLKGRPMEGLAEYRVLPGHEEALDRVLVAVTDVTEIQQAQEGLRASEARFRGLFEQSPVAMAELDLSGFQQGLERLRRRGVKDLRRYLGKHTDVSAALLGETRIIAVNDAMVRLHGVTTTEELIARYAQFRDAETTAALMEARVALAEGAIAVQVTSSLYKADGRKMGVIMDYLVLPGSEETWDRVVLAITDVTAIQEVQDRLRESEERYRVMFEQSPVAMWELDFSPLRPYIAGLRARGVEDLRQYFRDNPGKVNDLLAAGRVLAINQATVQMEGVATKEEVLAHTGPDAPETRSHMVESRIALAEGQTAIQIQQRGYTASGKTMEGILNYLVLPGHEEALDRVLVAITDVTAIREAQTALQEAHRKLMTAVEDERRRLAAELHDSVAQDLVALELSLRNSARGLVKKPTEAEAAKVLQSAVGSTNRVVQEIREICHGLYPSALETFGLVPSLKQLAAKCTDAGLPAHLRIAPEMKGQRFGAEVEIAAYRIAQEAVNNALRHSRAKKISISLEMEEGKVVLSVADNGKGFIPDRQPASSLGLVSMRERAKAVGGELQIDSHKKGTTVTLYIPVGPP